MDSGARGCLIGLLLGYADGFWGLGLAALCGCFENESLSDSIRQQLISTPTATTTSLPLLPPSLPLLLQQLSATSLAHPPTLHLPKRTHHHYHVHDPPLLRFQGFRVTSEASGAELSPDANIPSALILPSTLYPGIPSNHLKILFPGRRQPAKRRSSRQGRPRTSDSQAAASRPLSAESRKPNV